MESVNVHVSVHSIGQPLVRTSKALFFLLMSAIPDDLILTDGSRALTLVSVRNKSLLVHHTDMQSMNVHVTGHSIWPFTENSRDRQCNAWHCRHRYHHWLSGHRMVHQSQCNHLVFAMGSFMHLHWLHNDLIASWWQLPFIKVVHSDDKEIL